MNPLASYDNTKTNFYHLSGGKMAMVIILILAISCTPAEDFKSVRATNYDEDSDTGLVTKFHENGKIASSAKYINGKKHGIARSYYESGLLKAVVNYRYGVKQGEAKLYYKKGQLFRTSNYLNNELNGVRRKYRPNGKLLAEIPYRYGWEGVGLKEYLVSGHLKKKYAPLTIQKVFSERNKKITKLKVFFEGDVGASRFYVGQLIQDKFLHKRLVELEVNKGVSIINMTDFPQQLLNKEITIVGQYTTRLKNPYIVQKTLKIR